MENIPNIEKKNDELYGGKCDYTFIIGDGNNARTIKTQKEILKKLPYFETYFSSGFTVKDEMMLESYWGVHYILIHLNGRKTCFMPPTLEDFIYGLTLANEWGAFQGKHQIDIQKYFEYAYKKFKDIMNLPDMDHRIYLDLIYELIKGYDLNCYGYMLRGLIREYVTLLQDTKENFELSMMDLLQTEEFVTRAVKYDKLNKIPFDYENIKYFLELYNPGPVCTPTTLSPKEMSILRSTENIVSSFTENNDKLMVITSLQPFDVIIYKKSFKVVAYDKNNDDYCLINVKNKFSKEQKVCIDDSVYIVKHLLYQNCEVDTAYSNNQYSVKLVLDSGPDSDILGKKLYSSTRYTC